MFWDIGVRVRILAGHVGFRQKLVGHDNEAEVAQDGQGSIDDAGIELCTGGPAEFVATRLARQASGQDAEQRRRSASEECKDEVVESRDDDQGREKHGKSTNKAPSVDLPASNFVCMSHFFTRYSVVPQAYSIRLMKCRMLFQAGRFLPHTAIGPPATSG